MAIGIVKTINGVKQLVPLTTDSGQGLPLGAWTSFEDDQPRNGYLKAGTTFNQSDYPALYNMLGTNVVPERFDHNRISEQEVLVAYTHNFVLSTKFPFTAVYDGVYSMLIGTTTIGSQVTVNGTGVGNPIQGNDVSIEFVANKGDIINITGGGQLSAFAFYATYYKHPMFIKAVIGSIEDSASDQVVQNINNSRSYSTEEVNTGKKWIDGKPIYRRTFEVYKNNVLNGWTRSGYVFIYQGNDLSIDELISNSAITSNSILTSWAEGTPNMDYPYGIHHFVSGSNHAWSIVNANNNQFGGTKCILTIEYTKTTD